MRLTFDSHRRRVSCLPPTNLVGVIAFFMALLFFACARDTVVIEPPADVEVSVAPSLLALSVGQSVQLSGVVRGSTNTGIT
jgi:hypothetical protein